MDAHPCHVRCAGHEIGLVSDEEYQKLLDKKSLIASEIDRMHHTYIGTSEKVTNYLISKGSTPLKSGATLAEVLCRPEIDYLSMSEIDSDRPDIPSDVAEQVEIEIKYEGYIERQIKQVEQFKKMESRSIPIYQQIIILIKLFALYFI